MRVKDMGYGAEQVCAYTHTLKDSPSEPKAEVVASFTPPTGDSLMRVGLPDAMDSVDPPSVNVEPPNETVPTSAGMVCTSARLGASWIHSADDSEEA
jgi:hypothetical protein